jgi:hypothetical protein
MLDPCPAVDWFWEKARDKVRAAKTTTKGNIGFIARRMLVSPVRVVNRFDPSPSVVTIDR